MGSPAVYRTLFKEIKPLCSFPLRHELEKERKADPRAPWFVSDLGLSINTLLFGWEKNNKIFLPLVQKHSRRASSAAEAPRVKAPARRGERQPRTLKYSGKVTENNPYLFK